VIVEFEDDDLRRLYVEPAFRLTWMGPDLIKHYRRKLGVVANAKDERDLAAMRSLHFEKLVGDRAGQHSIRLNDQWRLILRLRTDDAGRVAVIVEVVDYH
jgi:proteic killer suppression protein